MMNIMTRLQAIQTRELMRLNQKVKMSLRAKDVMVKMKIKMATSGLTKKSALTIVGNSKMMTLKVSCSYKIV